jgi:hypothetical protein
MSSPIKRPPNRLLPEFYQFAKITQLPSDMKTGKARIIVTTEERYGLNVEIDYDAMLNCGDPLREIQDAYYKKLAAYYAEYGRLPPNRHDRGWPHANR